MSRTRKTTLAVSLLELPPIVVKSCAAHNSETLCGPELLYPLSYFHETLTGCRGHWVEVLHARMATLIDLVQELASIVSQNCKILCGP